MPTYQVWAELRFEVETATPGAARAALNQHVDALLPTLSAPSMTCEEGWANYVEPNEEDR